MLDLIRWLAAVIVVLSHIKGLFFRNYSELEHHGILVKILYAATSVGHQSVMVFFVLSGMVISANVMKAVDKDRWSWRTYLLHRLTRLYIVLIPALILGYLWDHAGSAHFGGTGVYEGMAEDRFILNFSSVSHLTTGIFLGNLLFLQGIVVDTFGSNGPLWSLSYEFWYYILFPCVVLFVAAKTFRKRIGYLLLFAAICLLTGSQIMFYFLIWLLGFALHLLPVDRSAKRLSYALALLPLCGLGIGLAHHYAIGSYAEDFLVALAFSCLVYAMKLAFGGELAVVPWLKRWSASLAGYSYSLYLVHFPLLVFMHALVYDRSPEKWLPTAGHILQASGLFAGVLFYSWCVSFLTERRTKNVRDWLERILQPSKRAVGSSFKRPAEASVSVDSFVSEEMKR